MEKKIKNILVTGGAGFLGSHIADELSDRGYKVTIADLKESPWLRSDQNIILGDLKDPVFIKKIVKNQDAVFHLAALADLNTAKTKPLETVEINISATVRLLYEAKEAGVERFMFASTVYVYSREGGFYRCSKQACENYIEEFNRMYNIDYTILRYGSLYGPRSDDSNGVYRLLKNAFLAGKVSHNGGPHDKREYIHVEDAAKLSADALNHAYKNSHLVLTGSDTLKIRDLFSMISEILGKEIEQEFSEGRVRDGHYSVTPYAYIPKIGKKLTTTEYVDMGQGLLQVIENIERQQNQ